MKTKILSFIQEHLEKFVLLFLWVISIRSLFIGSRMAWNSNFYAPFSLAFLPVLYSIISKGKLTSIFINTVLSLILGVFSLQVMRDPYFIQPIWVFYLKSFLIIAGVSGAMIHSSIERRENLAEVFKILLSIILFLSFGALLKELFENVEKFNFEKILVACWGTSFFLIQQLKFDNILDQIKKKLERPTFLFHFSFFLLVGTWGFIVYKLEGSYQKVNFSFAVLVLCYFVPKWHKLFLILILFLLNIQTGWQVYKMNFEVSFGIAFLLALAVSFIILCDLLPRGGRIASAVFAILAMAFGLSSFGHLYHYNLEASKNSLVQIATRMEMYNEGKIEPIKKEISSDAKKVFGAQLFTLIKYHPVDSYQEIFGPNLKAIFDHSRPMYSDENYNKFKSQLNNVLSRLNINWYVKAKKTISGKSVTIHNIGHDSNITKLEEDDIVSRDLNFKYELKDGRVIRIKPNISGGNVEIAVNDQLVQTISYEKLIYDNVPQSFEERQLQLHLQPEDLEKTVELQGVRLRIIVNRIYGRKMTDSFKFQQISGRVFLKFL